PTSTNSVSSVSSNFRYAGRVQPLFVELLDKDADTAAIHNQLIPHTSKRTRTPSGSLLAYPKSEAARTTLLNPSFSSSFRCRPTQGATRRSGTDAATRGGDKRSNLFVVVRGVDRKYDNDRLSELFGRTSTRMYSATAKEVTGSIRVRCHSEEDKKALIKQGFSFNFRTHRVDDYRQDGPRQCFRCQEFGHLARDCTGPQKCKNCAGDHLHTDCKATMEEAQMCGNCQGSHPSTFKGCPAYREAKEKKDQEHLTYAQKTAKSPPVMESVRLATVLSEAIFASLKPSIQGLEREAIYTAVAGTVSAVYRTRVTASQMLSLGNSISVIC
ncbi:MAG: hypothetical protein AAFX78_20315, partial [Cyanobacteria bacterium J06638_20]